MEGQKSWQERVYETAAKKSPQIIPYFKFLYFALLGFVAIGGYFAFTDAIIFSKFYRVGAWFGRAALVLLAIVVLPGILGRFGIEIRITRIITIFRRQLGILVFLLAFGHFHLVRGFLFYSGTLAFTFPRPFFEVAGVWAFTLLFLMFLTSNNYSVKKLGKWWKRLHRVVYVVLWLVVLHTAFQRISVWSVLIFLFASLETSSLVFAFIKKRRVAA